MTTTHFRDQAGQRVGLADVESLDELGTAVIDGRFEQRWVVDIERDAIRCRTCHDCGHGERIERMLRDHGLLEDVDDDRD